MELTNREQGNRAILQSIKYLRLCIRGGSEISRIISIMIIDLYPRIGDLSSSITEHYGLVLQILDIFAGDMEYLE